MTPISALGAAATTALEAEPQGVCTRSTHFIPASVPTGELENYLAVELVVATDLR